MMIAEMAAGRMMKANPVVGIQSLLSRFSSVRYVCWLGWWGNLCLLLTLSFYVVVGGWSVLLLDRCFAW